MKTLKRLTVVGLLGLLLSQSGCVVDREGAHSQDDAARQDADQATQRAQEEVERAERRTRDDQCAGREHDPDCQNRDR